MVYKGIDFLRASGWQNNDDAHHVGSGASGYRLVFKALRLVASKELLMEWQDLRIKIFNGEIKRGGMSVVGAVPSRIPDKLLLIDSLVNIKKSDEETSVEASTNMVWNFQAWEESLAKSCFIEIMIYTKATRPDEILEEGRRRTAAIKTILELSLDRLIGVPITEEIGEIFKDWHWNRNVGSITVGSESQLNLQAIESKRIYPLIIEGVTQGMKVSDSEKIKIRLASLWFWKADKETDMVNAFISTWIAIEALEMKDSIIAPVIDRLSIITKTAESLWKIPVGRLYGIRGGLVHGNISEVEKDNYEVLRLILRVLLEARLFSSHSKSSLDNLLEAMKFLKF